MENGIGSVVGSECYECLQRVSNTSSWLMNQSDYLSLGLSVTVACSVLHPGQCFSRLSLSYLLGDCATCQLVLFSSEMRLEGCPPPNPLSQEPLLPFQILCIMDLMSCQPRGNLLQRILSMDNNSAVFSALVYIYIFFILLQFPILLRVDTRAFYVSDIYLAGCMF